MSLEIQKEDFSVIFKPESNAIVFTGSIRLQNLPAYEPIKNLLKSARDSVSGELVLDMKGLNFLNSSGITTLSMFVIDTRNAGNPKLKVIGSNEVSWQTKSLANLKKLWNEVELVLD